MSSLSRVSMSLFHQPFVVSVDRLSGAGIGRSALSGIVRHHSDHVEQTGEQLQGEVEDANPQTWGGGKTGERWAAFSLAPVESRGQKVALLPSTY